MLRDEIGNIEARFGGSIQVDFDMSEESSCRVLILVKCLMNKFDRWIRNIVHLMFHNRLG